MKSTTRPLIYALFAMASPSMVEASDSPLVWSGGVALGYGYESNVTVDEIDLNVAVGDQYWRYQGELGASYSLTASDTINANLKFTEKQRNAFDQLDLSSQFFSTGYNAKRDGYSYGFTYRYVDSQLSGSDFLTMDMYSPFVSVFLSKKHYVRLAWTHMDKDLASANERDASVNELAVDYYHFINGLNRYLIFTVKRRNENTLDPQFSFDGLQLRAAYEYRFELRDTPFKARVDVRSRRRDFDDAPSDIINAFRRDDRDRVALSLDAQITDNLSVGVEGTYVDNESSIESLSFHEHTGQLLVSYQF